MFAVHYDDEMDSEDDDEDFVAMASGVVLIVPILAARACCDPYSRHLIFDREACEAPASKMPAVDGTVCFSRVQRVQQLWLPPTFPSTLSPVRLCPW